MSNQETGETAMGKTGPKTILSIYVDRFTNLLAENRMLRFVALCAFLATVWLALQVAAREDRTKTIVVPFGTGVESLYMVGNKPLSDRDWPDHRPAPRHLHQRRL